MGIHTGNKTTGNASSVGSYDTKGASFLLATTPAENADNSQLFVDSSSNDFVVTRNGDAARSSANPYVPNGYWGVNWPGTSELSGLEIGSSLLGSSQFCIEFWMNVPDYITSGGDTTTGSGLMPIVSNYDWYNGVTAAGIHIYLDGVNKRIVYSLLTGGGNSASSAPNNLIASANNSFVLGQWTHVACTRDSTNINLYINGTLASSVALTSNTAVNYNTRSLYIGRHFSPYGNPPSPTNTRFFKGNISNFRLTTGSPVYTVNFTPSTSPLIPISGTQRLLCQDNRFIDRSGNNFAITRIGDAAVANTSPFTNFRSYNPGIGGGSVLLDGTKDYLNLSGQSEFAFGTGDFTVEFWIYFNASGLQIIYDSAPLSVTGAYPSIYITSSSKLAYSTSGTERITGTTTVAIRQWHHVSLTRSGTSTKLFLNGVQEGSTYTDSNSYLNGTSRPAIGVNGRDDLFDFVNGYISNLRVVKGTAVYTANFTPPTSPLTAITNTSLLLSYDEKSNTFIDASSNNFAITKNADATQSALSPYVPSGWWSGQFDGNLSTTVTFAASNERLLTGDFTLEFWINAGSSQVDQYSGIATPTRAKSTTDLGIYIFGYLYFEIANSASAGTVVSVLDNKWHHVVLCRTGSKIMCYYDGVLKSTASYSGNVDVGAASDFRFGRGWNSDNRWAGSISNFRLVNGSCLYNSDFPLPAEPPSSIAGTKLLCFNNNRFFDASSTIAAATISGTPVVSSNTPLPYTKQYSPLTYYTGYAPGGAGSMSLNGGDGTADYLTVANNAAFDFGSGNFTIELWVYLPVTFNSVVIGKRANTVSAYSPFQIGASANSLSFLISFTGFSWGINATSSTAPQIGAWNHIALTRNGSAFTLWLNGLSVASGSNASALMTNTTPLIIGAGAIDGSAPFTGNIAGVRLVKGTSLYNAAFTPPTNTLTAVSGTSLLLNFNSVRTGTNSKFKDSSVNNFTVTRNGDATTASFNPFTPTGYWSGYFDGSGDVITIPRSSAFLPAANTDFTVEAWIYVTAIPGAQAAQIVGFHEYGTSSDWILQINSSMQAYIYFNALPSTSYINTTVIPLNTWTHVAVSRSGTATNNLKVFVNGVGQSFTTNSTTVGNGSNVLSIGADQNGDESLYTGYISNLRFVNGTGLYTSDFTPSTTPLTDITNTSLLCLQDARFIDRSTNNFTLTRNADVKLTQFAPFNVPSGSLNAYSGSAYLDGTGDYLDLPSTSTLTLGTLDFTLEFWVYANSTAAQQTIYEQRIGGLGAAAPVFVLEAGGSLTAYRANGIQIQNTGANVILSGTWNHVAWVRIGNNFSIYINGALAAGPTSLAFDFSATQAVRIGANLNAAALFAGYLSNLRVIKGRALYTAAFTPPTAPLSPTVSAPDPYFGNTSLLLTTNNTSGAQNNTFLDSSTNAFSVTRNGDTTQGSFNPYMPSGYWSGYFDGTEDYLSVPDNTAWDFGTGDFTVEAWYYPTTSNAQQIIVGQWDGVGGGSGLAWVLFTSNNSSRFLRAATSSNGSTVLFDLVSTSALELNAWNHVAFVRSGTTFQLYLNGAAAGSGSTTSSSALANATNALTIGASSGGTQLATGYISNVRVVKGTAVYSGSTYTVPITPLSAITNTSLLCLQDNRFIDNSSNNFTITRNGDTRISKFAPFNPPASYSTATYGGSGYFDGDGDFLSFTGITLNGDFSAEAWFYKTANPSVYTTIFGGSSVGGANNTQFTISNTGALTLVLNATVVISAAGTAFVNNQWNHVVWARKGTGTNNCAVYVNGVRQGTGTSTNNVSVCSRIGDIANLSGYRPIGYISNLRLVVGNSAYDTANATIAVPTAPLTDIAGTSLLLNFNNAGIYDATTINDIETEGNAQASTTQAKFGTTSMYFDGTGDWLITPSRQELALGSGDFTVEFWIYLTAQGTYGIYDQRSAAVQISPTIYTLSGNLRYYTNGADRITGSTLNAATWYHVALTKSGTSTRLFVDGTQVGSTYTDSNNYVQAGARIGSFYDSSSPFNGYIDDLRITTGYARYTANFTAPTSSIVDATSTPLLLKLDDAKVFDATNNTAITTIGDAKVITGRTKYGPTSVVFDGTGDYLTIKDTQSLVLGASDFTIEFWINFIDVTTLQTIFDTRPLSVSGVYPTIYIQSGTIRYYTSTADRITSGTVVTDTWYHVALVRKNSVTCLFINGQLSGSPYADTNSYLASSTCAIGGSSYSLDGTGSGRFYIQDFKVTRGEAKYGSFTVPTSELTPVQDTTLLLKTGSTNGAQNATFVDSSTNNFTITRNGAATQTSFNPHIPNGYWGGYFDGTGDDLRLATNAAFALGTGDFTFEAWINPLNWTNTFVPVFVVSGTGGFWFGKNSSNFVIRAFGVADQLTYGTLPTLNTWTHVVGVRSGTTLSLYYNGTRVAFTTTNSYNFTQALACVGGDADSFSPSYFPGYISNARLVKGTAVYDPTQTTLTVPTTPLTAITNTSLLCLQDNRFIDRSANNFTITRNGDAKVVNFDPFTPPTYTPAAYGGSGYFDTATNDFLDVTGYTGAVGQLPGDFTYEAWVYPITLATANNYVFCAGDDRGGYGIAISSALVPAFLYYSGSGLYSSGITGGSAPLNTWTHIACVRRGSDLTLYVNGVSVGTGVNSATQQVTSGGGGTSTLKIGRMTPIGGFIYPFNGYISNLRIVKGTAVYTNNFAPEAGPLRAIDGTTLLTNFANAGVYDAVTGSDVTAAGNTQASTTQARFGTTSMYFDGVSDALVIPASPIFNFGSNSFTIELWYYKAGTPQTSARLFQTANGDIFNGISLHTNVSGSAPNTIGLFMSSNGSSWNVVNASNIFSVSDNVWTHIAIVRNGTNVSAYKDGVLQFTTTTSAALTFSSTATPVVGGQTSGTSRSINGYIDDLRIVNGRALYTTSFTPPTRSLTTLQGS